MCCVSACGAASRRVARSRARPHARALRGTLAAGVETANVKMSMNPFCEIAVEEAVRMVEAKVATEVRG